MERKELYANIKASRYDKRKMDELRISPEAQDLISKVFYTIYGGCWYIMCGGCWSVSIHILINQSMNQSIVHFMLSPNQYCFTFQTIAFVIGNCIVLCLLDFCSFCHGAIVSSGDASSSMGNRKLLILIATPV